jgi:hypothetical protein
MRTITEERSSYPSYFARVHREPYLAATGVIARAINIRRVDYLRLFLFKQF